MEHQTQTLCYMGHKYLLCHTLQSPYLIPHQLLPCQMNCSIAKEGASSVFRPMCHFYCTAARMHISLLLCRMQQGHQAAASWRCPGLCTCGRSGPSLGSYKAEAEEQTAGIFAGGDGLLFAGYVGVWVCCSDACLSCFQGTPSAELGLQQACLLHTPAVH